jgi:hypothetical protein
MLKTIALAGLFLFTSAVSTAATTSNAEKKLSSTQSVPKAPQPKGFCRPLGNPC